MEGAAHKQSATQTEGADHTHDSSPAALPLVTEYVASSWEDDRSPEFYADLFDVDFVHTTDDQKDDLLFYVPHSPLVEGEPFFVVRRTNKGDIPSKQDERVDWKKTYYLNTITNCFKYTLVMEISYRKGTAPAQREKRRVEIDVWASPTKVHLDDKKDHVEHTYPAIFFAVNNFAEVQDTLVTRAESELVCVKLLASGDLTSLNSTHQRTNTNPVVIFSGAVGFTVVRQAFSAQVAKKQKGWRWTMGMSQETDQVFLDMKGPGGKGKAQMAVQAYEPAATETEKPSSSGSPTTAATWGFGGAFKKLVNTTITPAPSAPVDKFQCSITYITLPWNGIIEDIAKAYSVKT